MGVTQSVNLYAKLDRSGPKIGALAWIGAATLATVTGYGVLAGFAFLKANDLSDAAAQRGAENVAIEHRLAELRDDPYAVQNLAIQRDINQAREERALKERVLAVLRRPEQRQRSFSEVLLGLARQHQPGIALSSIHVTGDFDTVDIGGEVLRADLVPRFLCDLGAEGAFAGLNFARIVMARGEDSNLRFEASSNLAAGEEPGVRRLSPEQPANELREGATAASSLGGGALRGRPTASIAGF